MVAHDLGEKTTPALDKLRKATVHWAMDLLGTSEQQVPEQRLLAERLPTTCITKAKQQNLPRHSVPGCLPSSNQATSICPNMAELTEADVFGTGHIP